MRTLALDVGTKTIGVAVSDENGVIATGITTIKRRDIKSDLYALRKIIDHYKPSEILVGVPYGTDGRVTKRAGYILNFIDKLKKSFTIPVKLWDESFSTADAERVLIEADLGRKKRKRVVDKMAAVVILQDYLNARDNVKPIGGADESK